MKKTATAKKIVPPTLEERLEAILAEVEDLIEAHIDKAAAECPGVPRGVVAQTLGLGPGRCRCQAFRNLIKEQH